MSTKTIILTDKGLVEKELNRRKAIRERCLNCSGWAYKDVEKCKFKKCQLYPYRLGKVSGTGVERNNKIKEYCIWCMGNHSKEVRSCTAKTCPLWVFRVNNPLKLKEDSVKINEDE